MDIANDLKGAFQHTLAQCCLMTQIPGQAVSPAADRAIVQRGGQVCPGELAQEATGPLRERVGKNYRFPRSPAVLPLYPHNYHPLPQYVSSLNESFTLTIKFALIDDEGCPQNELNGKWWRV